MPNSVMTVNHRRFSLLVVVFIGLTSLYMLTYSARIESTDTLFLFDATGSLVQFGDTRLDVSAGVRPPPPNTLKIDETYPLPDLGAEVLQVFLAAPLYWLAWHFLPGVGLIHAVYLFNIFVSAMACVVLYQYALTLGYNERVAVIGAFFLGVGTIVWPYSKTFFQEPLTLLLLLTAALLLEKWRQSHYRAVGWLLTALLVMVGALLSKIAAAIALPGLMIIAAPALFGGRNRRQVFVLFGAVSLLLILLLLLAEPLGLARRLDRIVQVVRQPEPYVSVALHSYLFSIGGSIWGTSPVLLLALPGGWLLYRQRSYRYVLSLLVLLVSFAVVYAFWQGGDWFGGLSWPPRFLIPIVPFGLIVALPVIDRITRRPFRHWLILAVLALVIYAVWVQLSSVTLWWRDYSQNLPPEANGLGEWGGGLNRVQYLRWVVIPQLWATAEFNIAWVRIHNGWVPLAFGFIIAACIYLIWRYLKASVQLIRWHLPGLVVGLLAILIVGLLVLKDDPLYSAGDVPLPSMLSIMAAEANQPDDVILLSDLTYERYFTNSARLDPARIVSLPFHPGERPSPEQSPAIESDNPDLLIHPTTGPLIYALAGGRDRLWLLASSGPFVEWSVRPVERFMAAHYYPLRELQTGPQVRLIEYSTAPAPDRLDFVGPAYTTDLVYGDDLQLLGYELPQGSRFQAGAALPISFYWQATRTLEQDYTVAWFLRTVAGEPVVQGWDLEPVGGFAPTSSWRSGVPVWDNRALRLPSDLQPGDYRLWVVVYQADATGNINNLSVMGSETVEGYIGVLPTVITVAG